MNPTNLLWLVRRAAIHRALLWVLAILPISAAAASWTQLINLAPHNAGTMLLMTDGTIMVQGGSNQWMRLTPDSSGSYISGSWTTLSPMSIPRLYFASQVLPSGQVWLVGGEYSGTALPNNWSGTGEIYDPVANSWTPIATYPTQSNCDYISEFGGAITKGSPVVTGILTTTGFETGWTVTGTGIPGNTTILSVDSNSQIHLSQNATSTNANGVVLSFSESSTGNVTNASTIITGIPSTAGFQVGWTVSGTGIPAGATISSIDSSTQIHISSKATATGTGVALTFGIQMRGTSCAGDTPSILLPGGQILVGSIKAASTYSYNIAGNAWSLAATKVYGSSSEQGWAKLADGRVITYDIAKSISEGTGYAELYDPVANAWSSISPGDGTANGVLPVITSSSDNELGPSMRLQDGRMLLIGANGNTALYTPATNTWAPGPMVEGTLNGLPFPFASDDAPGAILPNGHVIFAADAGPGVASEGSTTSGSEIVAGIPSTTFFQVGWNVTGDGIPDNATITSVDSATQIHISQNATATASGVSLSFGGPYAVPAELFDFDPVAGTVNPVSPAIPDTHLTNISSYVTRMLILPTGQLLFADGTNQLWVYTPDGAAGAPLLPTVTSVVYSGGGVYTLTGTQLNGQSAGSSYGDDVQCDENYPVIRMVSASGSVYYAKTTNWSTVGVGTGAAAETVNFTLNPSMPVGTYSLIVTGAGLSSNPVIFSPQQVITIQTSPPGLQFSVDGGAAQTAPQTLNLSQGTHSLSVVATQSQAPGTQFVFIEWSDGTTATSDNITVGSSPATYTAAFQTQYQLTTAAFPAAGGTVTPASAFYNAGAVITVTATPNSGYTFSSWSGAAANASSASTTVTMSGAESVTANFSGGSSSCSFSFNPASASLPATGTSTVETCPNSSGQPNCGVAPETPQTFMVTPSGTCGPWTATSSNPEFLQITSSAPGSGPGTVGFTLLNNTHTGQQSYSVTVASGSASAVYTVTEAGSGDSQVYREVYALYEQLLGRDPDPGGFAFWTGSGGAGLGQMADSFLTSPEAFNSGFAVMAAYQAATGAPPTFAQFTAAVTSIRAGAQTVPGLFNGLIGAGYAAGNLYQNLLGRVPTGADSACINTGLSACFQALIGYPSSITPVGAANNEFQSTGIYHAVDHTNGLYVQMIYYVTLSRDPDPGGFAFWTGVANSGGAGILFQGSAGLATRIQILGPGTPNQGFIGSSEFQGLFAN